MIKYFNQLFAKNDNKFEEVRLWIALIFDDFKAYNRSKEEINNACEAVYDDLGNKFFKEANNQEKCQALNYYLNHNRKKEQITSGK